MSNRKDHGNLIGKDNDPTDHQSKTTYDCHKAYFTKHRPCFIFFENSENVCDDNGADIQKALKAVDVMLHDLVEKYTKTVRKNATQAARKSSRGAARRGEFWAVGGCRVFREFLA